MIMADIAGKVVKEIIETAGIEEVEVGVHQDTGTAETGNVTVAGTGTAGLIQVSRSSSTQ